LFFKKKIEELNAVHENEKNNIIVSYEHTVEKLNQGYVESKEKYANIIKQREDYIKELITEHQKEINDLKDFVGIGEVEEGEEQGPTLQSKIDDLNEEVETIKEDLLKYWVGTQAQYDALNEKEQGKLYIIIN
jgi:hypothetical protein